ncbi:MAG TPA: shikimate kinase [Ilumatobacteraceae bacterium]|nr:shikimate kinase [Ilumatobacteraceae bacterium]
MNASRHLVLVGMMGVGKSTVGRAIASELGRPLYDSDEMIEQRTGRSVREIWTTDGEPAFRELETDALLDALVQSEPCVIAAAGGVVLSEANRAALHGPEAHVVWLRSEVDVLLDRVRQGGHRPLLDDDPEATLRRLYDERAPLYQEVADAIVSVDNRSINDVTKAVLRCCG